MDIEWERIYPAVDIDLNTADRLFKCFDSHKTVVKIEMFLGGRSTTNYQINLKESDQKFILRIYSKNDRSWHKEYALQNSLKSYLPVPEMYYLGEENLIIDRPFSIVQFIEGLTLDRYISGNQNVTDSLAHNIGELLAVIHQKEFVKEGFLDEHLNIIDALPPILTWYDNFLNSRAGKRLDNGVKIRLIQCLKENNELIQQMTSHFVFSHGDFRTANLMVKHGILTGIIDWEGALSAPDYFDIGQFIRYKEQISEEAKKCFIDGYRRNAKFQIGENWEKVARLMDLVNILSFLDIAEEKPRLFADMNDLLNRTLAMLEK